jgi:hypothetical protein
VAALYCESPDLGGYVVSGRIGANQSNAPYVDPYGNGVNCEQATNSFSPCVRHYVSGTNSQVDGYQACGGWNNTITVFRTMPLEAEKASPSSGTWWSWCPTCSNSFRISGLSGSNNVTFYNVYADTTGQHTMYIYYTNGGSNSSAYFGVQVNGGSMKNYYGFGPTGDWSKVAGATITVNMNAGSNNTIVISGNGGQNQADLDWITID